MEMALEKREYYTYSDYLEWPDDVRYELIDGVPYMMGAPTTAHQAILGELFFQFKSFLKGHPCKVFMAPLDVRLNADDADDTVVQPDLVVVCDKSKIDTKGIVGAPDLIVEILSPSTQRYDRLKKFDTYLRYGVNEYWLIDPEAGIIDAYVLQSGGYVRTYPAETDQVPVKNLPGLQIDTKALFSEQ